MACGGLPLRWEPIKLYFADPQAGQVGFFGTIKEHGHPVILGLRLKIENHKIGEIEAIALRKTAGVFSEPQKLVDKPIFHQTLAPSERRPRAELIRVANSYFEGMEAGTRQEDALRQGLPADREWSDHIQRSHQQE